MKSYKTFLLSLTNKELEQLDSEIHQMKIKRGIQKQGKKPATSGMEWLWHSMVAFNGNKSRTGYITEPEDYVEAYRQYKAERNKAEAVGLVKRNYETALDYAKEILNRR